MSQITSKYKFICTDAPFLYKEQILEFWAKYLPGTPLNRFEWMASGNPAGATWWVLAILEENNQLVGTITLFPKSLIQNGREIKAACLGDFMIDSHHRVFGPALALMKKAVGKAQELEFKIVYTFPNKHTIKLAQKSGLSNKKGLCCFVKPIKTRHYLEKKINPIVARLLAPFFDYGQQLLTKELTTSSAGFFQEHQSFEKTFDILYEHTIKKSKELISNRTSDYLNWKYISNQNCNLKVISYSNDTNSNILGYSIYSIEGLRIVVIDIFPYNDPVLSKLISKIITIARKNSCHAINFITLSESHIVNKLKLFGFIPADPNLGLYYKINDNLSIDTWEFLEGDRNL